MKKYLVLLSVSTLASFQSAQAQENTPIETPTTVETAPAVVLKPTTPTPTPTVLTPTTVETAPTETPKITNATPTADPVAPTETPKPTEPTPTVDPVVPTETPKPADATPTPKKTGTYQAPATQPKNTKTESTETPKSAEYTSDELPSTGAQSTLPLSILGVLGLLSSLPVLKKKNN